jgi:hypothetical protein
VTLVLGARGGSLTLRRLVGDVVLVVVYEEWLVVGAAKVAFMPLFKVVARWHPRR